MVGSVNDPAYPTWKIPLFAVGFTGWKQIETLESHLKEDVVDGILIIDAELYRSVGPSVMQASGPTSLWGRLCSLLAIIGPQIGEVFNPLHYFCMSRH